MEREVIVRVDSKENYVCRFPSVYLKDKEKAQWYMEKIKSPSAEIYKAKWTANGLIYTHKMNAKGEFEEIVKSQEQIKAEAFDILKRNIPINLIRQNMFVFECREYLTAEEIEILQKAGLE